MAAAWRGGGSNYTAGGSYGSVSRTQAWRRLARSTRKRLNWQQAADPGRLADSAAPNEQVECGLWLGAPRGGRRDGTVLLVYPVVGTYRD